MGNRADCNQGCPGTEYECKKDDLFQYEGRCIDRSKIEQTLVRSAAKVYIIDENLAEDNADVRRCTDSKDGTKCTCTKVQRPGKAEPGENCSKQQGSSGWCFLDNVSNHEYPSENCFEDAYWSTLNGKFYSNLACENQNSAASPPTPPPTAAEMKYVLITGSNPESEEINFHKMEVLGNDNRTKMCHAKSDFPFDFVDGATGNV